MKSLLSAAALTALKVTLLPGLNLVGWIIFAIVIDLITGIAKAYVKKEARTSSGFRKTIVKLLQYFGAIAVSVFLTSAVKPEPDTSMYALIKYLGSGLQMFILYIEATSIFENMYAMDSSTKFAKYFVKPVLSILTWQLKNNPATQLGKKEEAQ